MFIAILDRNTVGFVLVLMKMIMKITEIGCHRVNVAVLHDG